MYNCTYMHTLNATLHACTANLQSYNLPSICGNKIGMTGFILLQNCACYPITDVLNRFQFVRQKQVDNYLSIFNKVIIIIILCVILLRLLQLMQ